MPFAGYESFDACVAANRDKDDPSAYCASIMRKVEGGMTPGEIMTELIGEFAEGVATYRDGDWVRARPMGWDLFEDNPDVIVGGAPTAAPLTGLLTIVKSSVPGVARYSVSGWTVDPATITVLEPPKQ